MRVTIAQLNPTVGDIEGNLEKVKPVLEQASRESSDLLVLTELFLVGYPPKDLLEREWFIDCAERGIERMVELSGGYPNLGVLFGAPVRVKKGAGHLLHNSAILAYRGKLLFTQHKSLLPTYDVFDEGRYFDPGTEPGIIEFKGEKLGISICEDAWNDPDLWPRRLYSYDPIASLAQKGATLLVNISSSPFHVGKEEVRFRIVSSHARKHGVPFVFVNQIGANDDLVFDGRSIAVDRLGNAVTVCPSFKEHIETIETRTEGSATADRYRPQDQTESARDALVLGIRDYMRKCGFHKAVLGLSGGIDSAVVAVLASEAIGPENVLGVAMPSRFTKKESTEYAKELALRIGIGFEIVPIDSIYQAYIDELNAPLKGTDKVDVTLENIQARIRGNILMAVSNEFGHLVLSTGNKSELAVGYSTLYGDMSGGLAVISDVPKTMVYKIAGLINAEAEIIPRWIIDRPPSAELRPDQTDQDTLPPYEILDRIIHYYVDDGRSAEEISALGLDSQTVKWVIKTIDRNEYKRRQAAPGLRITSKAFGTGRRMPIAAKVNKAK
jgi:NAD+ synthase (glutamine-hydrolysing)